MKHTRAIAYIQQLCSLGLGGEAIMPLLSQALHGVVPMSAFSFFWVDQGAAIANTFQTPFTPELTELYLSEFYNKRELEAWPGFSNRVGADGPDVGWTLAEVDRARFYQSDFYHCCMRPRGTHDSVYVRIRDGGRIRGLALISRGLADKTFTQGDLDLLARLSPYLCHALRRGGDLELGAVDSGESGLVILDRGGQVKHLSKRARQLLFYATHPLLSPRAVSQSRKTRLPPVLTQLVQTLVETFQGGAAAPPVAHHQNPWGRFVFRAYWLEKPANDLDADALHHYPSSNALIGVTIQHQEPLALKLMESMQSLPLSAREREVCLCLVNGLTQNAIATKLGVRSSTVITYVRKIYEKLDIHSHEELLQKLSMP